MESMISTEIVCHCPRMAPCQETWVCCPAVSCAVTTLTFSCPLHWHYWVSCFLQAGRKTSTFGGPHLFPRSRPACLHLHCATDTALHTTTLCTCRCALEKGIISADTLISGILLDCFPTANNNNKLKITFQGLKRYCNTSRMVLEGRL